MRTMRAVPLLLVLVSCATAPATRSPLREQLSAADTAQLEQASRTCLTKTGWKVDPLGGVMGGAEVVTAYKNKTRTDLYIYSPDMKPRVTGGPPDDEPFWSCLGPELGPAKPAPSASSQ
jgi:hypothetical protein